MCRVCSCSQLLGQYPDVISCVQTMEERSQDAQASFKDGKGRKRRESVSLYVCVFACGWYTCVELTVVEIQQASLLCAAAPELAWY